MYFLRACKENKITAKHETIRSEFKDNFKVNYDSKTQ